MRADSFGDDLKRIAAYFLAMHFLLLGSAFFAIIAFEVDII